jgi:hypothetical protein
MDTETSVGAGLITAGISITTGGAAVVQSNLYAGIATMVVGAALTFGGVLLVIKGAASQLAKALAKLA